MLNHITMFQPSAIDNALSTLQIIHKLINQINVVIDEVNSIDSKANEYTDEKIKELSDNLQDEMTNLETLLKNYTDISKKEVKDYTDEQIENVTTELHNSINRVYTYIDDLEQTLRNYIDLNDNEIKLLIYEIKDELINLINEGKERVFSPVDGRAKSIQKALYDIFNLINMYNGNINIRKAKQFLNISIIGNDDTEVGPKTFTYGKSLKHFRAMGITSYLKIKNYAHNNEEQNFIFTNRLDFCIKYSFFVLYYLAWMYIPLEYPNKIDNITNKLSDTIFSILGYGYCDVINMIGWTD